MVRQYGDLLFDLCDSVLWSPLNAQVAFRSILKELRAERASNLYRAHEREWVLRVAVSRLRALSERHGRHITPSERIQLDANPSPAARIKHFDYFFHRLSADEQILLLLKDKYALPYDEIASALGSPAASLKVKRQQALRTLEDWLWDKA